MKIRQSKNTPIVPLTIGYLIPESDPVDNRKNKTALKQLSRKKGFSAIQFVIESESPVKPWQQRTLKKIIDQLQKGDRLLVIEVYTIGRTGLEVYEIMRAMQGKGIQVYSVKGAWEFNGIFRFPAGG